MLLNTCLAPYDNCSSRLGPSLRKTNTIFVGFKMVKFFCGNEKAWILLSSNQLPVLINCLYLSSKCKIIHYCKLFNFLLLQFYLLNCHNFAIYHIIAFHCMRSIIVSINFLFSLLIPLYNIESICESLHTIHTLIVKYIKPQTNENSANTQFSINIFLEQTLMFFLLKIIMTTICLHFSITYTTIYIYGLQFTLHISYYSYNYGVPDMVLSGVCIIVVNNVHLFLLLNV